MIIVSSPSETLITPFSRSSIEAVHGDRRRNVVEAWWIIKNVILIMIETINKLSTIEHEIID
jgi:hypothetical protein